MSLNAHEKLAVFIIVCFAFALPISLWVCKKQGFGRSLGWFYLVTLPVFRIAGGGCTLGADQQSHPKIGLQVAAAILNGLGLISLELTLLGLIERANAGMQQTFRYASKGLRLCHFMLFVAGGLAISGGVNSSPTNSPDSMGTGHALRKSSAILLLFVFIILVAVTAGILARINQTWVGDRLIIYAVTAIFPFLLVRVIYTLVYSFDTDSAAFNPEDPNVYIQAFMQISMECIVSAVFLAAGLTVDPVKLVSQDGVKEGDPPGLTTSASTQAPRIAPGNDVELGTLPAQTNET